MGENKDKSFKNVTPQSLNPPDHEGFMTKCGGKIQTWKKRWFILKGTQLYYFADKKAKKAKGVITVTKESFVKEDMNGKIKKNCIAVGTTGRVFFMYADTVQEQQDWVKTLNNLVDKLKGGQTGNVGGGMGTNMTGGNGLTGGNTGLTGSGNMTGTQNNEMNGTVGNNTNTGMGNTGSINNGNQNMGFNNQTTTVTNTNTGVQTGVTTVGNTTGNFSTPTTVGTSSTGNVVGGQNQTSGGSVLVRSKEFIPFMIDDSNKVLEFWNIWFDSVPKLSEIPPNTFPTYQLVISCDGNELSWKASGSQNIFIQKMVDFFWNVGAPESEIDRLNDFGALVNPSSIGSWINMSKIGGMDGGWFFPVPLSLKIATEACDPDSPENVSAGSDESSAVKTFNQWTESNRIDECIYVGRDMGAAPPRQTELRVRLNQQTVVDQLNTALNAFKVFKFPEIPGNILNILRQFTNPGLILSVITSSEGFVKIGILFPQPNWNIAMQLVEEGRKLSQTQPSPLDLFNKLNTSFKVNTPEFIEFQYLNPGFGYNVYKEEFNVFVHYHGQ